MNTDALLFATVFGLSAGAALALIATALLAITWVCQTTWRTLTDPTSKESARD